MAEPIEGYLEEVARIANLNCLLGEMGARYEGRDYLGYREAGSELMASLREIDAYGLVGSLRVCAEPWEAVFGVNRLHQVSDGETYFEVPVCADLTKRYKVRVTHGDSKATANYIYRIGFDLERPSLSMAQSVGLYLEGPEVGMGEMDIGVPFEKAVRSANYLLQEPRNLEFTALVPGADLVQDYPASLGYYRVGAGYVVAQQEASLARNSSIYQAFTSPEAVAHRASCRPTPLDRNI